MQKDHTPSPRQKKQASVVNEDGHYEAGKDQSQQQLALSFTDTTNAPHALPHVLFWDS